MDLRSHGSGSTQGTIVTDPQGNQTAINFQEESCRGLYLGEHHFIVRNTKVRLSSVLVWIFVTASFCIAQSPKVNIRSPLWNAEVLREKFTRVRNPLAATTIQKDSPGVSVSSAFQLHASILTADTGLLDSTRDWATRAHYSSIQATAGGVLVRTGNKLRLLSKDFNEIDTFTLPDFDRCMVSVSASQQTILVNCLSSKLKISRF
jgi:hypothetical protein